MPFIAPDPEKYEGKSVGDGQCVAFVKEASGAPQTSRWKEGERVRGAAGILTGTAIATFINGRYPSHRHGNHAAIYVEQNADGLVVWDQWVHDHQKHPVSKRLISFKGGVGSPSDDGDAFSVIET
jgi:hypothetical protein